MLMTLVCIPFVLLFAWFFLLAFIEIFGPFILAMLLLFKWTLTTIIGFIRYLLSPKGNTSPA